MTWAGLPRLCEMPAPACSSAMRTWAVRSRWTCGLAATSSPRWGWRSSRRVSTWSTAAAAPCCRVCTTTTSTCSRPRSRRSPCSAASRRCGTCRAWRRRCAPPPRDGGGSAALDTTTPSSVSWTRPCSTRRAATSPWIQHRSGALWVVNTAGAQTLSLESADVDGVERDAARRPTGRLWRLDSWLG